MGVWSHHVFVLSERHLPKGFRNNMEGGPHCVRYGLGDLEKLYIVEIFFSSWLWRGSTKFHVFRNLEFLEITALLEKFFGCCQSKVLGVVLQLLGKSWEGWIETRK